MGFLLPRCESCCEGCLFPSGGRKLANTRAIVTCSCSSLDSDPNDGDEDDGADEEFACGTTRHGDKAC